MASAFEIPLNPFPEQFSVTLQNVIYQGSTRWNAQLSTWVFSLADQTDVPVISNIPLIPGIDLLAQLQYLNIGVMLKAVVDNDSNAVPTFDNLGSSGHLYAITP